MPNKKKKKWQPYVRRQRATFSFEIANLNTKTGTRNDSEEFLNFDKLKRKCFSFNQRICENPFEEEYRKGDQDQDRKSLRCNVLKNTNGGTNLCEEVTRPSSPILLRSRSTDRKCENMVSPILKHSRKVSISPASPVLKSNRKSKRQGRNAVVGLNTPNSPVLRTQRRLTRNETIDLETQQSIKNSPIKSKVKMRIIYSPPSSPVLKNRISFGKNFPRYDESVMCNAETNSQKTQSEVDIDNYTSSKSQNFSSSFHIVNETKQDSCEYNISALSSQEAAVSVKSMEKNSDGSDKYVIKSAESFGDTTPKRNSSQSNEMVIDLQTPKKKKRFRKNGPTARLYQLLARRRSERRMLEHELNAGDESKQNHKAFNVVKIFRDRGKILLQCTDKNLSEETNSHFALFSVGDDDVKTISPGAVIRLHPPWQILKMECNVTVYLSVTKCEVIENKGPVDSNVAEDILQSAETPSDISTFFNIIFKV